MLNKNIAIPRIISLDLMRGYFLIAIILNHLQYWPNGFDWLTWKGQLLVSSAEGFFFISGLVLGIVRGRKLIEKPFKFAAKLLLKRGLQLYVIYVFLAILFTFIGWYIFIDNPGLKSGIASTNTPIHLMIWQVVTFQYLYGWADYLRLYCLFLFVSPLVLLLLRKNLWWVASLMSIGVWILSPFTPWPESVYLQPYNWQILFFGGMIVGYHWPELTNYWKEVPLAWKRLTVSALVSLFIFTLVASIFLAFGGRISAEIYNTVAPLRDTLMSEYFNKENLPFARLMLFLIWFWASFWLFRKFEKHIINLFGWLLIPFGTNSLYVYIVHAFLIFFAHLIIAPGNKDIFTNFIMVTGITALIWIMIRYKFLFKIIPR